MRRLLPTVLLAAALAGCLQLPVRERGQAGDDYRVRLDVPYAGAGGPTADLYQPAGSGPFPALVLVHGGAWNGRDRSDMTRLARQLVQHGYVVLNVDYRLAPAFHYPAAVDDVRAAVRWLADHAAALGVDAARLGGWGYSAGAQLVGLAALAPNGAPRLSAAVAGGMPCDFRRYPRSPLIGGFIGAGIDQRPDLWRDASPIAHVDAHSPPMFLYHGTRDQLVYFEDSLAMQGALQAAGVPVELHAVHGLGHVPTFVLAWGARRDATAFLDRYLKPPGR